MQSAPAPANEKERLKRLERYRILDTPPEEAFDRVTRIVAETIGVPIALVSLVDRERQWFKSRYGLQATQTPRDVAFCAHAILDDGLLVVQDASKDPRFADNPLVTNDPSVRFYAGAPLKTSDGFNLGTLCAIDQRPRTLTDKERQLLFDLSNIVVDELELRIALRSAMSEIAEESRLRTLQEEFTSIVSHELRTPLTSIGGVLDLMLCGAFGELPEELREMTEVAHRNSLRLTHLINDLLDIDKLAAGKMTFEMTPQPLIPLIKQALEENEAYGTEQRVRLTLAYQESNAHVRVDARRLLQVLSNLLSNAIKHSPEGGVVEVTIATRGTLVRVSVTDHGPGIPEEFRSRIFQKFAQADGSNMRQVSGTGLGLAISKELIERMSGQIDFHSIEGQGASFFFELPLSSLMGAQAIADSVTPQAAELPQILVVEDDPDAANVLGRLLKQAGYKVGTANSGAQALELLRRNRFHAMTLDLSLPDMSGLEIIKRVADNPETAELPIIVVSAKVEDGRLTLDGNLSSIDCLAKPVDETRLLTLLQKHTSAIVGERRLRVLHVEDDADLHQIVRRMIGKRCQIVLAPTLADARARMSLEDFDVVILDITMSDGNGWDLLPEIQRENSGTRVIILSGNEITPDDTRKVEAVLLKSRLLPNELLDAVTNHVRQTEAIGNSNEILAAHNVCGRQS